MPLLRILFATTDKEETNDNREVRNSTRDVLSDTGTHETVSNNETHDTTPDIGTHKTVSEIGTHKTVSDVGKDSQPDPAIINWQDIVNLDSPLTFESESNQEMELSSDGVKGHQISRKYTRYNLTRRGGTYEHSIRPG
ncbi:hypothetical protein ScPMuIL_018644 [Solemya velum]